jgi:hypothetical protein
MALVTLLVVGAHIESVEADPTPDVTIQVCDADYDVLAPAPRPPSLQGSRSATPLRPGAQNGTAPSGPDDLPAAVRAPRSPALHALRTVVLRC